MTSYTDLIDIISKHQNIYVLDGYDPSYSFLIESWKTVCGAMEPPVTPKQFILLTTLKLDTIIKDKEEIDLSITALNQLTEMGYCVRDISLFQPCVTNCGNVIVTKELYNASKHKWKFLPSTWGNRCSVCRSM